MAKITVLGATGFAGGNIAKEAAERGHELTLVSRSTPLDAPAGARVIQGSVLDGDVLAQAIDGADVVIGALSPRGDMEGKVADAYAEIAGRLAGTSTRFMIIGGFGSLKNADGERIVETDAFEPAYKPEARELFAAYERVSAIEGVDWTYVSPAGAFGSYIPDQVRRGEYRTGGDTPVLDAEGNSAISGADFAIAIVDAIEQDTHRRAHVSFAY
ncbi:NAD(P)H-binding protein [Agrococcus sp. ARC_14]|uniref:NAD(P)-dependent oxidoreductase n=1 Tax=Agrococcus sp. ARC_14 TaxID=2919927 RepID=UPI001F070157|nr:NAD(P)H-binding protein [Agrococcus sp. ARC_14]MCH1881972.1 NAD(P)H-binding protein [Agrococcus sp. ARC_14]